MDLRDQLPLKKALTTTSATVAVAQAPFKAYNANLGAARLEEVADLQG